MNKERITPSSEYTRNYLANERTFLAWIRTSLGIMAFGFVVEKFALFIQQIAVVLAKQNTSETFHPPSAVAEGNASHFGILLIAFGAIIGLFSFMKYKRTIKQIEQGVYHSSLNLAGILTIAILVIGVFLIYYLISA